MSETEAGDNHQAYLEERSLLVKNEFEAYRDFDKWLITVAGSALGISMAFLKDVVPIKEAAATNTVLWAWALLLGSLVACLVSTLLRPMAYSGFRRCLDDAGESGFDGEFWTRVRTKQDCLYLAKVTVALNVVALLGFVAGMGCLIAFLGINVSR